MEGAGHDAVGRIKCLLDPVAVMHVNVDVEDALEVPRAVNKNSLLEELEDAEDNVVDVAET